MSLTREQYGRLKDNVDKVCPWRKPQSVYETDGPSEATSFVVFGHKILVIPTELTGVDSGRRRMFVECTSCGVVVHGATTGPRSMIFSHVWATIEEAVS